MTVVRYSNNIYQGLAADTKPTNVPAGAIYRATDTGDIYHYNGSSWDLINGASKSETLTNKTLSGSSNTLSNIPNSAIAAGAAIDYSKLNLTGSIVNADINASAAIVYSKLNLSGGIVNADVNSSAAIAYSKLNLSGGIVNADVSGSAAIVTTKLADSTNFALTTRANSFGDFNNTFKDDKLKINNPADTFAYTIIASAIAADRNVTLPLLTGNDVFVTEAFTQTLTNKTLTSPTISTILNTGTLTLPTATTTLVGRNTTDTLTNKTIDADGTGNSITNIENADIKAAAGIVYSKLTLTDSVVNADINSAAAILTTKLADSANFVLTTRTNSFGDFNQVFKDNRILINNPADTFAYTIIADAIAANRSITLPLLTGNDVAVTEAFTQTLTNKTINLTNNSVTDTSTAAGDLARSNGTKFLRFARGSANQLLRTNAAGTDIEWATITTTGLARGNYDYFIYYTGSQYEALNGQTGVVHATTSTTDAAAVINAVINSLTSGGKIGLAGATTFLTRTKINMKDKIHLQGAGESTILKQDATQNLAAIIESDLFTTKSNLAGMGAGGGNGGPHSVYLSDFVIEGNKANNTSTATDGIRFYGYNWHLKDIHIRDCKGRGMYSEWDDDPAAPSLTTSMETYYLNVKIHDCDGDGWLNRGPHDWEGNSITIYDNVGHGYVQEYSSGLYDGGGFVNKLHCYANDGLYGIWLKGGSLQGTEITGESCANATSGVNGIGIHVNGGKLNATDAAGFGQDKGIVFTSGSACQVKASEFYNNAVVGVEILMNDVIIDANVHDNNSGSTGKGIKIGASGSPIVMCNITGTVKNNKTTNFDWADSGNSAVNIMCLCYTDATYPTVLTGSPNMRTCGIQILNHASGTLKDNRFGPTNYDQVQKALFDRIDGQISVGMEPAGNSPVGVGLLASAQLGAASGTVSHGFDNWENRYVLYTTQAAVNTKAGLGNSTGNIAIVDRRTNPRLKVRCKVPTSSASRLYVGFSSATAIPASDTPLASADSGVLMGWDSADTDVSYWANDGSAGITNATIGGASSVDGNWKVFEFQFDDTNSTVSLTYNSGTPVKLTTNIPAQDTQLCVYACVGTTAASSAARTIWFGEILLEKDFIA